MATSQPSGDSEHIPKALVYSLEQSSLLVISSNASYTDPGIGVQPYHQHNSDQDAGIVHDTLIANNYIQKGMMIQSSSKDCTKEGVLDAVKKQVSLVSGEDGLFVLVYIGGACDNWDHGLGLDVTESESGFGDGFVDIAPDESLKRYSLVLNDYQATKPETHVSGDLIGKVIQGIKPKQVQIILECPFAENIATDIQESLSDCKLMKVASQTSKKAPCYHYTLGCSTFTYFFTLLMSKTRFIGGLFPLHAVFTRVGRCCEALSSLDLVRESEWLKKNTSIPKAAFMTIPDRADDEMERMENGGDDGNSEDQIDGSFRFQSLIAKFYKWDGKRNKARLCNEAKDWVRAVTEVCLLALADEKVLEGKVLESAVGSMMYNIATIQNAKGKSGISNSNLFIKAYMLVVAAVDIADPSIDLDSTSLLMCASDYYIRFMHDNSASIDTTEMLQLVERMKKDNTSA